MWKAKARGERRTVCEVAPFGRRGGSYREIWVGRGCKFCCCQFLKFTEKCASAASARVLRNKQAALQVPVNQSIHWWQRHCNGDIAERVGGDECRECGLKVIEE